MGVDPRSASMRLIRVRREDRSFVLHGAWRGGEVCRKNIRARYCKFLLDGLQIMAMQLQRYIQRYSCVAVLRPAIHASAKAGNTQTYYLPLLSYAAI